MRRKRKTSSRLSSTGCPYESEEQAKVFDWANLNVNRWPCLEFLYSHQSGARMGMRTAVKEKRGGMKKGVPDIFLPFPSGSYHGLYIEMKRLKGAGPTEQQLKWLKYLQSVGFCSRWVRGGDNAIALLERYLLLED